MRIMLYDNIVRGGGMAHTFTCYNFAYKLAKQYQCQLVFPNIQCGHSLGRDRTFEKFFGIVPEPPTYHRDSLVNVTVRGSYNMHDELQKSFNEDNCHIHITRSEEQGGDLNFADNIDHFKSVYNQGLYKHELVDDHLNIGVHIRRGDIIHRPKPLVSRIIKDEWYVNMLTWITGAIKNRYPNLKIAINIFTQGKHGKYINENKEVDDIVAKFKPLANTVVLHLDGNVYQEFNNLVHQHIIVGGKSGFSPLAGLYSDGFKFLYNCSPGNAMGGTVNYKDVTSNTTQQNIIDIVNELDPKLLCQT